MAFTVTDTGIGIAAGQAAADLRGLPAGRRHDQPPLRRHRARAVDQPRDRAPARRRDPRRRSAEGEGRAFTLLLPARTRAAARAATAASIAGRRARAAAAPPPSAPVAGAGRAAARTTPSPTTATAIGRATASLLIVEDDRRSRRALLDAARDARLQGRRRRSRGDAALALAHEHRPDAILLDCGCPTATAGRCSTGSSTTRARATSRCSSSPGRGRASTALRAGRRRLPREAGDREDARRGAASDVAQLDGAARAGTCWSSRTTRRERTSIVDADRRRRRRGRRPSASSEEALARARATGASTASCSTSSCPKASGFELLERIKADERCASVPMIVYTGKRADRREETRAASARRVDHRQGRGSPERLLDETALFLHRRRADAARAEQRRMLEQLRDARPGARRAARC